MFERIQDQVNSRIDSFIADIAQLAKEAARETLSVALGAGPGGFDLSRDFSDFGRRRKGGKRSPEEITQMADGLLDYIAKNPGQRMESIARALGSNTQDLTLPIKKLILGGRLRTEGQKRATSYFVAAPGDDTGAAARRRRKKARA
ncbi:MAG TPA: hypothetical protein VNM90_24135 [Haliangium sp.]|nr:hypothetical protein [Haliangium sp.]